MKKKIFSFLLALVLIVSTMSTAYAASTANIVRAVDNNPNLGKKTFNVTVTFKTSTTAANAISADACDNSSLKILFPTGTQKTSVSKNGASSSWDGDDGRYYYYMVNLGFHNDNTNLQRFFKYNAKRKYISHSYFRRQYRC